MPPQIDDVSVPPRALDHSTALEPLLKNLPLGAFRASPEGRLLGVNTRAARMLGYSSAEEMLETVTQVDRQVYVRPEDRERFVREITRDGEVTGFECEFYKKDRSTIWVSIIAREVRDEAGRLLYYEGANVQITELKHHLTAERNLLRTLIDHLPDYIYVKDLEGRHILNNRANLRILGQTLQESLGKTVFDYFPRELAEEYWRDDLHVLSSGEPIFDREEPLHDQRGTVRWITTSKLPLRSPEGETTGLVGISHDITERKQTEREIKKLAAFVQFNPNPVFEFDEDGKLAYANPAASEMARGLGKAGVEALLPESSQSLARECLASRKSRTGIEAEVDGRIISWSFHPILQVGAVHCYAVDVTDRYRLEAQLRQSQKMESIGQLAGGVAHDFNNLLTVIEGHSALLEMASDLPPELVDSIRQISGAAGRAANLTRQLLLFSRRQPIQLKEIDLNEVVGNITKMLRRLLGEDIALEVHFASNPPLIKGDPGMLEQVLVNLAVNSRDAMPRGGRLTIHTEVLTLDRGPARAPDLPGGPYVRLRFSDTGEGIPSEVFPHIFEPFFTTKEVGKGTGLGLATVYGIIKQHRGFIEVESSCAQGATFNVFLPLTSAPSGGAPAAQTFASAPVPGTETILVVEDEDSLRNLVKTVLLQQKYTVLEAASGPEALEIWKVKADEIALVITDIVMPGGINGRELIDLMRADRPELKAIYTTGYSAEILPSDIGPSAKSRFLAKPYHPAELTRLIREILDSPAGS